MRILLDANILLRCTDLGHPHQHDALAALDVLEAAGWQSCIVPQSLYEYWVVATRPSDKNGMGRSVAIAAKDVDDYASMFMLLPDDAGILPLWRSLVETHRVQGKTAHDTRLVAAMLQHGVSHLLTFNVGDFERYSEIEVLSPEKVANGQSPV
jgi:predicted nucleic acid-binding protein